MQVESYILPPSSGYPLAIAAKRYRLPEFQENIAIPSAQTLILLHSTSFHKETWEPTLKDLFSIVSQHGNKIIIREAWSIDCPNHGESGQLNHRVLVQPGFPNFTCERYAQAVHRFLSAGIVDVRSRNLVGIGHSLGANAILLLQQIEPAFPFSFLIIVEPMVSAKGREHLAILRASLTKRASKRQEYWPSRESFERILRTPSRRAAKWDDRVVDSFVEHAVYWNSEAASFCLACKPEQEAAMYRDDPDGPTKPVEVMDIICHSIHIHLILGSTADLVPEKVHQALIDPNSGRQFASVVIIDGVGHLVPQEKPSLLAARIYDVLASETNTLNISRL